MAYGVLPSQIISEHVCRKTIKKRWPRAGQCVATRRGLVRALRGHERGPEARNKNRRNEHSGVAVRSQGKRQRSARPLGAQSFDGSERSIRQDQLRRDSQDSLGKRTVRI